MEYVSQAGFSGKGCKNLVVWSRIGLFGFISHSLAYGLQGKPIFIILKVVYCALSPTQPRMEIEFILGKQNSLNPQKTYVNQNVKNFSIWAKAFPKRYWANISFIMYKAV